LKIGRIPLNIDTKIIDISLVLFFLPGITSYICVMEEWKDIKDYEGLYQISNLGRVKSLRYNKERILKPGVNSQGYHIVVLFINGIPKQFYIHRLVYQEFIGELIAGLVIDHLDNSPSNNNINNLQQVSQRKNVVKGGTTKKGSSKYVGVFWNKERNKWKVKIGINGRSKFLGYFDDEEEAAQAYQNALKSLN